MSQNGGGKIGSVSLVASGEVSQSLQSCPKGPIAALLVSIGFSIKNNTGAGAAFDLVVSTEGSAAAEGTDDMDLILNTIITRLAYFMDPSTLVGTLTLPQWRTVLGLLNRRDLGGTLVNGADAAANASSALPYTVVMRIPISLAQHFMDGNIFQNGSERIKTGELRYTGGANVTNPTVVLAGGTGLLSAISVSVSVETGAGTENDIGNAWSVSRQSGYATRVELDSRPRIALLDTTPAASNAATAVNVGEFSLQSPALLAARFQMGRLALGGFDITARCTPYQWWEPERVLMDFLTSMGKPVVLESISGVTSFSLYDVVMVPPPPVEVERIGNLVGGGGPLTLSHPTPRSLPPGSPVPAALTALLPIRPMAGRLSDGGTGALEKKSGPKDAAVGVMQKQAAGIRAGRLANLFRRG